MSEIPEMFSEAVVNDIFTKLLTREDTVSRTTLSREVIFDSDLATEVQISMPDQSATVRLWDAEGGLGIELLQAGPYGTIVTVGAAIYQMGPELKAAWKLFLGRVQDRADMLAVGILQRLQDFVNNTSRKDANGKWGDHV